MKNLVLLAICLQICLMIQFNGIECAGDSGDRREKLVDEEELPPKMLNGNYFSISKLFEFYLIT
jgi:hypothetical protein